MPASPNLDNELRVASEQHLGLQPRDCQLQAANRLSQRTIVEMDTGEGKTLAVAMSAIAHAMAGRWTFIATANDYLAARDAEIMRPLYLSFGLRCDAVVSSMPRDQRAIAYRSPIVYGTIRELGFDTLRDALDKRNRRAGDAPIVPALDALIVDEADSVLIDEATTPLVISEAGAVNAPLASLFEWSAAQSKSMRPSIDFEFHESTGTVALTDIGSSRAIHQPMPPGFDEFGLIDILHAVERAVFVEQRLQRDVHYVLKDDRVVLVDEYTGRLAESKQMGGGLHQAIEAKERLSITPASRTIARMTIQELTLRAAHLSGITATAHEDRREFHSVYGMTFHRIPPHVPSKRRELPTLGFASGIDKHAAIISESQQMLASGRPVLIGTRTVAKSEALSRAMAKHNLDHELLNAAQSAREAEIISLAAQAPRITIATNMAGRGADIRLSEATRAAGGLHVIISEPHASPRIDRQLAGRCGRQGDPGTTRQYLAADDELLRQAVGDHDIIIDPSIASSPTRAATWLSRKVKSAQSLVGKHQRNLRRQLAHGEAELRHDLETLGLDPYLDRIDLM